MVSKLYTVSEKRSILPRNQIITQNHSHTYFHKLWQYEHLIVLFSHKSVKYIDLYAVLVIFPGHYNKMTMKILFYFFAPVVKCVYSILFF